MNPALTGYAVNLEMWWTHLPRLDRVDAAVASGFGSAEIWFWPNWDIEELGRRSRSLGLEIVQLGGWDFEPRLHEVPAAFRAGIQHAVEVAVELDVPRINVNGPYLQSADEPGSVRAAVTETIAGVVDILEDANRTLMVEPMNREVDHPGYSLPFSADVLDICRSIESPHVGINWDLYHLAISEGDLSANLERGADHIAYVQIADHPGRHEPGTGDIPYAEVLEAVSASGYGGPIGLECSPRDGEAEAVRRLLELGNGKQTP